MSARSADLNLLPKEIWEKGLAGQLLSWLIAVGRYIVIFTELVVISAFLYRFFLDRQLTSLRASIKNKQATISSFGSLETNFRLAQTKLNFIKEADANLRILRALNSLSQITPADATLTNLTIDDRQVFIKGRVASQSGLATLLSQAQSQPDFADVILENVQSATDKSPGIEFTMVLIFPQT